jgi:hypothetical protein
MFPGQLLVLGHEASAVGDLQAAAASGDLDGLPDEGKRHRVREGARVMSSVPCSVVVLADARR